MEKYFFIVFNKDNNQYTDISFGVCFSKDKNSSKWKSLTDSEEYFEYVFSNLLDRNNIKYDKISLNKYSLKAECLPLILKFHFYFYGEENTSDCLTELNDLRSDHHRWYLDKDFTNEEWDKFIDEVDSWVGLNPKVIKKFKDFYK